MTVLRCEKEPIGPGHMDLPYHTSVMC